MHQDKNINDELLELAASVSDNYKEAATLASIALHEVYQYKFFSDQYISYHLMERDDSGILTLSLGNNTYNGTSHKSDENELSYDLFERVKKMLPVIKEDNDSSYQNDEDDGEYDLYKKTKKERYIRGSEKLLLKRLIDKVEQSNPDEFLEYIKSELSKDDKYLIRLRGILNERVLFEMLKVDLSLTESQNKCDLYDINLYFPENGEKESLLFKFNPLECLDLDFIEIFPITKTPFFSALIK